MEQLQQAAGSVPGVVLYVSVAAVSLIATALILWLKAKPKDRTRDL